VTDNVAGSGPKDPTASTPAASGPTRPGIEDLVRALERMAASGLDTSRGETYVARIASLRDALDPAIAAHETWEIQLERAIRSGSGEFQVDVVRRDDCCALGRWLHGEGQQTIEASALALVRDLHAGFHLEAADVLQLAVSGRRSEAIAAMDVGTTFSQASAILVAALRQLAHPAEPG